MAVSKMHRYGSSLQEFRRHYEWIIMPVLIIGAFLLLITFFKSVFTVNQLEGRQVYESKLRGTDLYLHAEYPDQILFTSEKTPLLNIWLTCGSPYKTCPEKAEITLSTTEKNVFFALQQDTLQWKSTLRIDVRHNSRVYPILLTLANPSHPTDWNTTIKIKGKGATSSLSLPPILFEGERSAKQRLLQGGLLESSGIVFTIITAVIAGLNQLSEQRKRQRWQEIEQSLIRLKDENNQHNLAESLQEQVDYIHNWGQLGNDLKKTYSANISGFFEKDFLARLDANLDHLEKIVNSILEIKEFLPTNEKLDYLNLFERGLQRAEWKAILELVDDNPDTVNAAKIIAQQLPSEKKDAAVKECPGTLHNALMSLKEQFGFPGTQDYPFRREFAKHLVTAEDDFDTTWLNKVGLSYSPFLDAENPFMRLKDGSLFLENTPWGFEFESVMDQTYIFQTAWDLRMGFLEYCQTTSSKNDAFFVIIDPAIWINFQTENVRNLVLHSLADQWLTTLAEDHTIFFTLSWPQKSTLCRLLVWHSGSPATVSLRLSELMKDPTSRVSRYFSEKLTYWMEKSCSRPMTADELNYFMNLRPTGRISTIFCCLSHGLSSISKEYIPTEKIDLLNGILQWLHSHQCFIVNFVVAETTEQATIKLPSSVLAEACNNRVKRLSNGKIQSFDQLFYPPADIPAELILASLAKGSPGRMLWIGKEFLFHQLELDPDTYDLDIGKLIDP